MSQTHVNILKAAKLLIQADREEFVCLAIKAAVASLYEINFRLRSVDYRQVHKETYDLLNLIEDSLGGDGAVDTWLEDVHGIFALDDDMRIYRLAWLDNMIEYWQDKS